MTGDGYEVEQFTRAQLDSMSYKEIAQAAIAGHFDALMHGPAKPLHGKPANGTAARPGIERPVSTHQPGSGCCPRKMDDAVTWILEYLAAHGGRSEGAAITKAGDTAGFSPSTLRKARRHAGVHARITGSRSTWMLPDAADEPELQAEPETEQPVDDVAVMHLEPEDNTRREIAAEWLLAYLYARGGAAPAGNIKKAAEAAGISIRTLHRARDRSGVRTTQVWRLPNPVILVADR